MSGAEDLKLSGVVIAFEALVLRLVREGTLDKQGFIDDLKATKQHFLELMPDGQHVDASIIGVLDSIIRHIESAKRHRPRTSDDLN